MKKGHGRWPKIANRGHFVALLGAKNGTGQFILVIDAKQCYKKHFIDIGIKVQQKPK